MSILLRMYPGDAWALLIANVLVQVTVVILAAWLVARVAGRVPPARHPTHQPGCQNTHRALTPHVAEQQ